MQHHLPTIRKGSALFWFTLLIPMGIIPIGLNFILTPAGASAAFGIPVNDPNTFPYLWIKGIRDIFSGLAILALLLGGERRTLWTILSIAIPFCDGVVILAYLGFAPPIYVHWGTAISMTVVSFFLFRRSPNPTLLKTQDINP